MKRGFTMIELIFVIVILGILAAVAIPKLAATRDDAKLASIKTDVGTIINAVPAWYQGQKEASILNAASIDTNTWNQNGSLADFTFNIDNVSCVQVKIVDVNESNTSQIINSNIADPTPSTGFNGLATLQIIKGGSGNPVCNNLWDMITEQNITMAGKKIKW
jgi:general secretion pathway protein G